VFAFAFSGETYFTYAYKWDIGKIDWETGALLGIALKECVFVSLNQWEFTRGEQIDPPQPGKGDGFTQTIIHEVGHEFGLMHPHQYGNIGDFVYSAMGYFTDDYEFGVADKDALQRAHACQISTKAERLLNQMDPSFAAIGASEARNKLTEAYSALTKMQFASAIQRAVEAYKLVEGANLMLALSPYFFVALALGLVVVVAFVVMRRRGAHGRESSATQTYAVAARCCVSCGNAIMSQSLFCEHCGAKQR
jgi:hypothetical protein